MFFTESVYLGVVSTLAAFWIGNLLKNKLHSGLFNPILTAVILQLLREKPPDSAVRMDSGKLVPGFAGNLSEIKSCT